MLKLVNYILEEIELKIDIITAFPNAFSFLNESIIKRAKEKNLVEINIVDLRQFADDKRKTIDDKPFGGGAGMLLQVEPLYRAIKSLKGENSKVVLTSAGGSTWNQEAAKHYSEEIKHLIIICGHYEGVDHRITEHLVDEEVSIGNYVLSGGELASMVIIDSIVRLMPGALGNELSSITETSFNSDHKVSEHPQYTRPEVFKTDEGEEWGVPKILLSGNHVEIEKWKEENSKKASL